MRTVADPAGSIQTWVPFFLSEAAPAGHLVTSAGIVRLMEAVGFTPPSTRVAISRLCAAGFLERIGSGRAARYRLTPELRRTVKTVHARVADFGRDVVWSGRWTLVLVSVPDAQRAVRRRLQGQLTYLGFGRLREAVWIAARDCLDEVQPIVEALGLQDLVDTFHATPDALTQPDALLHRCWDIDSLATRYRTFIDEFSSFKLAAARSTLTDDETMTTWMQLTSAYEDLVHRDPELPPELLSASTRALRRRVVGLHATVHPALQRRAVVRARGLLDGET